MNTETCPVGEPLDIELSEWQCFEEDLRLLGKTKKELIAELGRAPGVYHQWRRAGIPVYVQSYLNLCFELKTLKA